MMFPLHRIVFPSQGDTNEKLFVQWLGLGGRKDATPLCFEIAQGFRTDTYFGVFAWRNWRRIAHLTDVLLHLRGQGRCRFALKTLAKSPCEDVTLQHGIVEIAGEAVVDLSLALSSTASRGVYLEVLAITDLHLESLNFVTRQPPVRPIDLGLIVTTFKRPEAVSATIENLQTMLAHDAERALGQMSLTIVDNGRDLDPASYPDITILPTPNLGGAGGFARGLSHLQGSRSATHACFMDDDAATEHECLFRVRRLLAYAVDDRTAVSGAMLRDEHRACMHEQGAILEWGRGHRVISRKHRSNLLDRRDLMNALASEPIGYGGWWLFAFPISDNTRYPYPLFVRGDDWLFSYLNNFAIEAMPGICSWQAGFETKISPTEQYLALKAFLVAELILRRPANPLNTLYFFAAWLLRNLFGYCYDRAALNCEALSDVLKGPEYWGENAALGRRLASLRPLIETERMQVLNEREAEVAYTETRPERRWRVWIRLLTLNGHIVPLWLAGWFSLPVVCVRYVNAPKPAVTFMRQKIIYKSTTGRLAFIAVRDTGRFFGLLARSCALLTRLLFSYATLQQRYEISTRTFCTKAWWDEKVASEMSVGS